MSAILSVDEALARILETIQPLKTEIIDLDSSLGRVLAEEIISDINLPPFDNSAMDGFAIKAIESQNASKENPIHLRIAMDIPAGFFPERELEAGESARIMTGAAIPQGADAVIPVEETDSNFASSDLPENVALYASVPIGASIRKAGENIRIGQKILSAGTIIRAAEIGILASLGKAKVKVVRKARVAIIGSGDELVGLGESLGAGQIYDSNSYTLAAMVEADGGVALRFPPAKDKPEAIREMFLKVIAEKPDLIVSSAGVSVGAADYIRNILAEIGEIGFWRINLRPGKPLAFGKIGDIPFFGLPGNPVSAMVTYTVLVRPSLLKLAGKVDNTRKIQAVVGEKMQSDGRRTYARVRLVEENGQWIAYETGTQSSGAHLSMLLADGLLIIPENQSVVEAGEILPVLLLR